jgi:hypothetical protein
VEEERAAEEQARWRYDKLHPKFMILYLYLVSEEERAAMAKPNGWWPPIPTNVSLEEHIHIMQARVDARFPTRPSCSNLSSIVVAGASGRRGSMGDADGGVLLEVRQWRRENTMTLLCCSTGCCLPGFSYLCCILTM